MTNINADFESLVPGNHNDRRRFLATSLGAGFALAVQPVAAQTAIATSGDALLTGRVSIQSSLGEINFYRAAPTKPNAPVVLVVSEIFGVHEYICDVCRRLAKEGYFAIAPELFSRQGNPQEIPSIPEILSKITNRTPDSQVMTDLDACVAWATSQGADVSKLFITGFCWGGRITWLYCAHNPRVIAGVAWYGRLVGANNEFTPKHPIDITGALHAPVLGLYGGLDAGIPLESVESMEAKLQHGSKAAKASEIYIYDNAPHAFHADYRPSYRREEAEDGWKRLLAWFARHGNSTLSRNSHD